MKLPRGQFPLARTGQKGKKAISWGKKLSKRLFLAARLVFLPFKPFLATRSCLFGNFLLQEIAFLLLWHFLPQEKLLC